MSCLQRQFNDKAQSKKPVVMAYIGLDDPMRGDSRGSVGVAKNVADILDGQYVYLDEAVLRDCFQYTGGYSRNSTILESHLKQYVSDYGMPEIVLGSHAADLLWRDFPKPKILDNCYNEDISEARSRSGNMGLSSHDLDAIKIKAEADTFLSRYAEIKSPLVAVYLGDNMSLNVQPTASAFSRLVELLNHLDEGTVFICPSRHTEKIGSGFEDVMQAFQSGITNTHIDVIGQCYEDCKNLYNPYPGLIGVADHHVMLGMSRSILSEVLFSGKVVASSHVDSLSAGPRLKAAGFVYSLTALSDLVFPDRRVEPPNVTREVAQHIADEYLAKCKTACLI